MAGDGAGLSRIEDAQGGEITIAGCERGVCTTTGARERAQGAGIQTGLRDAAVAIAAAASVSERSSSRASSDEASSSFARARSPGSSASSAYPAISS